MLHKTAQERYEKLKKVFHRLMVNFNRDDLDDYVQTANSLREWIQQDSSLIPEQKEHLERFIVDESLDWQICHQIANAQKHVRSTSRFKKHVSSKHKQTSKERRVHTPNVTDVEIRPGGEGLAIQWKPGVTVQVNSSGSATVRSNLHIYGAGEEILIECDGKQESALAFVIRSFQHFHYIFEVAPVPVSQRTIPNLREILDN
jgi:hypothetical protein